MKEENRITAALDGSGIEEAAKLAVPEEETESGYICMTKNNLFRMEVELVIKAV